jgi:hypothetical protein
MKVGNWFFDTAKFLEKALKVNNFCVQLADKVRLPNHYVSKLLELLGRSPVIAVISIFYHYINLS